MQKNTYKPRQTASDFQRVIEADPVAKDAAHYKAKADALERRLENHKRKQDQELETLERKLEDAQDENDDLHAQIVRLKSSRVDIQLLEQDYGRTHRNLRKLQTQFEAERSARIDAQDSLQDAMQTILRLEHDLTAARENVNPNAQQASSLGLE